MMPTANAGSEHGKQHSLHQKRALDKPAGGADPLHQLDLLPPGVEREPDRVGDDEDDGNAEQDRERRAAVGDELEQAG